MKFPTLLTAGLLIASSGWHAANAQREAISREDRREQRQQQMATMTPQQRTQFFENRFNERLKTATPEQRERMLAFRAEIDKRMKDAGIDRNDPDAWQKMQKAGIFNGMGRGGEDGREGRGERGNRGNRAANDAMRQMMEAAGITDFDTQDAIIAYVNEQNKARATLFQLAQTAATALQTPVVQPVNAADDGTEQVADARVATTFGAYETAVKAENERQEKALKELDAKINYSGTPRIKAFLTLVGILNNDVLALGGPAAIFVAPQQPGAMQTGMDGNPNGQGNWDGGGRGGRGGAAEIEVGGGMAQAPMTRGRAMANEDINP